MHATSRTNPTAIMSAIRIAIGAKCPGNGATTAPVVPFVAGYSRDRRAAIDVDLRLRLRRCAPISEPAEDLKLTHVSRLTRESGQAGERLPHVADDREPEAVRHDTDHGGGHAVDSHTAPDDGRVRVVPRGPDAAAQDDDRWRAG